MENIDVTGFILDEAVNKLKQSGAVSFDIKLTAPPQNKESDYNSKSRVVRQLKSDDGTVQLVVCNIE